MDYELIIIGAGAAGFAAAFKAEELGVKTLMINDSSVLPLGGTCVNVGCIPSKIMLHQAGLYYQSLKSRFRALSLSGSIDFVQALRETREMVSSFQEGNYLNTLKGLNHIRLIEGRGRLLDANTVETGKERFKGKYILISTGASTFIPPVRGVRDVDFLTNRTIFSLEERPRSIVILGGGPEAVEFAQIFHRFGIRTSLIQRSDRILTKFEGTLAGRLQAILEEEGIEIHTGTRLLEVSKNNGHVEVRFNKAGEDTMTVRAEKLLVATGLRGNTDELGLPDAGVETMGMGFVRTNNYMQSSQPHIYATGDVAGTMALETVAAREGRVVVENMFEGRKSVIEYEIVPRAVFTDPELASVGTTEEEYSRKYGRCLCSSLELRHLERAALERRTDGLIKMVVHPDSKEVIGVHMVGPRASEVVTIATYAIKNRMNIYQIRDTVHIFPTMGEALKKVAQSFDRDPGKMPCCIE